MSFNKRELQYKVGFRIKQIREKKGILQHHIAALCDMEKSSVSRIEAGDTNPTIWTLYKIANALEVSLNDLIVIES